MSNTRRGFLQSGAALAAGLTGAGAPLGAQQAAPTASAVQVPKIKFGGVEISRMVLGVNPFYGFAHYNNDVIVAVSSSDLSRRPRRRAPSRFPRSNSAAWKSAAWCWVSTRFTALRTTTTTSA